MSGPIQRISCCLWMVDDCLNMPKKSELLRAVPRTVISAIGPRNLLQLVHFPALYLRQGKLSPLFASFLISIPSLLKACISATISARLEATIQPPVKMSELYLFGYWQVDAQKIKWGINPCLFEYGCACGPSKLFEGRHEILCDLSGLAVTYDPAIDLGNGRNLCCGACNEDLVCRVKVEQA